MSIFCFQSDHSMLFDRGIKCMALEQKGYHPITKHEHNQYLYWKPETDIVEHATLDTMTSMNHVDGSHLRKISSQE